jgi:hypothetical protein
VTTHAPLSLNLIDWTGEVENTLGVSVLAVVIGYALSSASFAAKVVRA